MTHSDRALKPVVRVLLTSAVLIVSLQLAVEKKWNNPRRRRSRGRSGSSKTVTFSKVQNHRTWLERNTLPEDEAEITPRNKCATLKRSGFNCTNPSMWFGHQRGSLQHETTKEPICEATLCRLKLVLFFHSIFGLEQSTWTKHTPPKTARKWTNITLEATKTRVSENERERGGRGGRGWGLLGAGDESGSCKLHRSV